MGPRLERVKSINPSGHKYGLVYPGVGWVMWREPEDLPPGPGVQRQLPGRQHAHVRPELQPTRQPDHRAVLQLPASGFLGYKAIQQQCRNVAMFLSAEIAAMGPFELQSDGSELPVFFFTLKDSVKNYSVYDVSDKMREYGLATARLLASGRHGTDERSARRGAQRNGPLCSPGWMLRDLRRVVDNFERLSGPLPDELANDQTFHH